LEPELFAEIYYKFPIQKTYACIRFQNFLKAGPELSPKSVKNIEADLNPDSFSS
jgi:hypothetical protein